MRIIPAYFQQTVLCYSESKDTLVAIEDMHPAHAANAAAKLLRESQHWASEVQGTRARLGQANAWMITQPLFRALVNRAGDLPD